MLADEAPSRAAVFALALILSLTIGAPASAHLGSTKLIWLELRPDGVAVRVDLDPIDVAYELELPGADDAEADGLVSRAPAIRAWAARVFSLRSDGARCDVEVGDVSVVSVDGLRFERGVRVELAFTCAAVEGAPTDPRLVFRDEAVFDSDRQHEAIVVVQERATVLRVGRQEVVLGEATSLGGTVLTFFVEGAIHLVTGYDHILFLLSLLLVAGAVAARDGRKEALRDVAMIVTAFTLGHSITLIAAALDVVTLPSRLVESAIAASIIAVAVWNLVEPEARRGLRWVAGLFGLVHGFGFSSVLRELVLPTGERVGALLAFNVGIEAAQLGLVALVVPVLAWAGGKGWYRRVVIQGGSVLVAGIASYWFVVRAFGL